jgi:hypothetical protein
MNDFELRTFHHRLSMLALGIEEILKDGWSLETASRISNVAPKFYSKPVRHLITGVGDAIDDAGIVDEEAAARSLAKCLNTLSVDWREIVSVDWFRPEPKSDD